jgi:hypothetical protein
MQFIFVIFIQLLRANVVRANALLEEAHAIVNNITTCVYHASPSLHARYCLLTHYSFLDTLPIFRSVSSIAGSSDAFGATCWVLPQALQLFLRTRSTLIISRSDEFYSPQAYDAYISC